MRWLNRLTSIRLPLYSDGMISDFELLSQKVGELAELAKGLRRENADLRAHAATLGAENDDLLRRMQAAQERVSALLSRLPDPDAIDEAASSPVSDEELT
jgi:cell division protein ZapB